MTENKSDFVIPDVVNFDQINRRALDVAATGKPRLAMVDPIHPDAFGALQMVIDNGLADPRIVGDPDTIRSRAAEAEFDLDGTEVISADGGNSVACAAGMARDDKVDIIARGTMPTDLFVQALLNKQTEFFGKGQFPSHIAVIKAELYPKLILLSDAAVNVAPNLKEKLSLAQNIIALASKIGIPEPRIAVLAAVEVVYPQMPVTLDAAVMAKMSERRQIKGGYVDGPLSFDCAVDRAAAESKGIMTSPVAGQADAMIAPNIATAYGIYKAMMLFGNAQLGGLIYGGRVPVALGSRSDSAENIYNSIALAVLAG